MIRLRRTLFEKKWYFNKHHYLNLSELLINKLSSKTLSLPLQSQKKKKKNIQTHSVQLMVVQNLYIILPNKH